MQVFQTFSCERFPEIGKSYLRADQRIECYTTTHMAYRTYAAVMIFLCKFVALCQSITPTKKALRGERATLTPFGTQNRKSFLLSFRHYGKVGNVDDD